MVFVDLITKGGATVSFNDSGFGESPRQDMAVIEDTVEVEDSEAVANALAADDVLMTTDLNQ
ncbi:hypothetical protein DYY67_1524 [Candidatus Nitrosotalea sp. TS]|nr:hypothetical protein [Candidatus Nitrosotalea sp. TS]